jgi:hypothetical protein
VTFGGANTLASTGAGSILFASTTNGPGGVTVNRAGATTFTGVIGGTSALATLSTDSGGTTILPSAVAVTTATLNDAVSTAGAITLSTGSISATNGANNFPGAVTVTGGAIALTTSGVFTINATGGTVNLTAGGFSTASSLTGSSATLSSGSQVGGGGTSLPITFGSGSVVLTGGASAWNLSGLSVPQPTFTPTGQNTGANVFYNNGCISGPACAGVFSVTASIGASVAQIAAQALKDAQSTDSVAKQIDYGFAGDIGTTPPMDHRIDETGISTPDCFEESRESTACK